MRFTNILAPSALALLTGIQGVNGGLIAYGLCQTGCNTVAVACYAAAGFTFGTVVAAIAAPPVILACNAALGTCSAACAATALIAPIP
ncbi:proteophosphoglycan 5 [Moniliophthora roreri MCA 2997]|uniref:Proteophosphoglycan 5 n=1 Tax=Moniliophthora roreri (strain MCA 2997) TaxID=1381753 RepID=V2XLE2_MONRO|nr:proteophosphoglycan 5 [Moniliophthora roreri MCA 2997]